MIMKKTLVVIKSIVKVKDLGDEVENKVINSEILSSETLFLQAFRKFSSFLLVLDLISQIIRNLFFRGFPDFDVKRYLSCHPFSSFTSNV